MLASFSNETFADIIMPFPKTNEKEIIVNSKKCKVQITDIPIKSFFSNTITDYTLADAIILVYDITQIDSYDNLNNWAVQIEQNSAKNVYKALIGNKIDLESERQVSYEQGEDIADQYIMNFFEVSAKEKTNIEETFMTITKDLIELEQKKEKLLTKKIKIIIQLQFERIYLECLPIDTILQIKNMINEKKEILQEYQQLKFKETILEDEKKLYEYEIKNESLINLVNKNEKIKIWISGRYDRNIDIKINVLEKCKEIKNYLWNNTFTTAMPYQLRLYYNNILLEDEKAISDYNIKHMENIIVKQIPSEDDAKIKEMENTNKALEDKINELEKELAQKNEELMKKKQNNEELNQENEIQKEKDDKMEELINELNQFKTEKQELIKKNSELEQLITELKTQKSENINQTEKNEKINTLNYEKKDEIKTTNNTFFNAREVFDLANLVKKKDEEIEELRTKTFPYNLKPGEKLMSVTFISEENKTYCSIICKKNDIFVYVENRFYEVHQEYRKEENNYYCNNNKINRFLSLEKNNIGDHDIIYLIK